LLSKHVEFNDSEATSIEIGASVTLTNLLKYFNDLCERLPKYQTSGLRAVCEQIERFASTSIRNVATIGGNICTASPSKYSNLIQRSLH